MNLKIIAYYLSIVILITGCIHSVNPFYTENDIITNDDIIGTWEEPIANGRESWTFEKKDKNNYKLTFSKNNLKDEFKATLIKLGENYFIDIYPEESSSLTSIYRSNILPIHILHKISISKNQLSVEVFDDQWIERKLKYSKLNYFSSNYKLIITSPTSEIQQFLINSLNNLSQRKEMLLPAKTFSKI